MKKERQGIKKKKADEVLSIEVLRLSRWFASREAYNQIRDCINSPENVGKKKIKLTVLTKERPCKQVLTFSRGVFFSYELNERKALGARCPLDRDVRLKRDFLGHLIINCDSVV